jgi:hypothetical protein
MSAQERVRVYLDLRSELLTASTPAEFSQLLGRILTASGLTASQVAIKATIPRSQAYNMVSTSRTVLPSKSGQVRAFVEACGLAPVQVALVMDLWTKLDQQAREQAIEVARPLPGGGRPGIPSLNVVDDDELHTSNLGRFRFRSPRSQSVVSYRPKVFIDLMFLVLEDDARTRRALLLLAPLALAVVAIVAIFTTWAVLEPDHATMIGGILVGGFLLPITTLVKSATRTRR